MQHLRMHLTEEPYDPAVQDEIRTATVAVDKPIVTTVQQLAAAVQAIESIVAGPFGVRSLQDHVFELRAPGVGR